ncbi:MAG: phosphatidate cytidylyltransferase [Gammaproteobacteria bacterium]|nr:phosphatidate cytidylyltransferase [Gammaproteobacteria bacterium]
MKNSDGELRKRVVTGIIAALIVLGCVFFLPEVGFFLFVGAVLTISAWEWANLSGVSQIARYAYAGIIAILMYCLGETFAFPILVSGTLWWLGAIFLVLAYPNYSRFWAKKEIVLIIGFFVLLPGFSALVSLKQAQNSDLLICLLLALIWGADVGAYFIGKAFGGARLAYEVSPGKSWSGFIGGIITGVLLVLLIATLVPDFHVFGWAFHFVVALAIFTAIISVLGDLTISMFKRERKIKDSGNLLPGHGGFLDRIDSLLSASPIFVLLVL